MAKIAFLFPGQGAQKVGMGKPLYDSLPAARQLFDEANEVLGYSLTDVCFNGPPERLNSTVVSQPALYVCSLAALRSLEQTDPDAVASCVAAAGLSLGEYTALAFTGSLGFRDGLNLVRQRGEAMQAASDATPSGMLSVIGPEVAEVETLCQEAAGGATLRVANLLCPGNTVISGALSSIEAAEKLASEKGFRTVRLAVAGAFHTDLMKPADEQLAKALSGVEIRPPRVPVWSNVDARPHTSPDEIRSLLVRQVLSPVRWEETMRNLLAEGADRFYEIGPGSVLAGLLKRVNRKTECKQVPA